MCQIRALRYFWPVFHRQTQKNATEPLIQLKDCVLKYFFAHQYAFSANQGIDEAHPITPLVNITPNFEYGETPLPAYSRNLPNFTSGVID
jgi:hypothetical protein